MEDLHQLSVDLGRQLKWFTEVLLASIYRVLDLCQLGHVEHLAEVIISLIDDFLQL